MRQHDGTVLGMERYIKQLEDENAGLKKSPAERCQEERNEGKGPCGACALCVKDTERLLSLYVRHVSECMGDDLLGEDRGVVDEGEGLLRKHADLINQIRYRS